MSSWINYILINTQAMGNIAKVRSKTLKRECVNLEHKRKIIFTHINVGVTV